MTVSPFLRGWAIRGALLLPLAAVAACGEPPNEERIEDLEEQVDELERRLEALEERVRGF